MTMLRRILEVYHGIPHFQMYHDIHNPLGSLKMRDAPIYRLSWMIIGYKKWWYQLSEKRMQPVLFHDVPKRWRSEILKLSKRVKKWTFSASFFWGTSTSQVAVGITPKRLVVSTTYTARSNS
jgi:hypothetical protein